MRDLSQQPIPIRRVTLADVARRANVHVTTVSMAMRDHPRLPAATRSRLRQLASRMGYRRDPKLQALVAYRQQKSVHRTVPTVAYVAPRGAWTGEGACGAPSELLRGASRRAEELGFRLRHERWEEARIDARAIQGIVLAPGCRAIPLAPELDWNRIAAVEIGGLPRTPVLSVVAHDYGGMIRMAADRAFDLGYRRIGFVLHRGWDYRAHFRWSEAFFTLGHALPPGATVPLLLYPAADTSEPGPAKGDWFSPAPLRDLAGWIEAFRPDVVIGKKDTVVPQLARMGLEIPGDLAFIDVFRSASDSWAAGVRQHHAAVGAQAIDLLSARIYDRTGRRRWGGMSTLVSGSWRDGPSCPGR